MSGWSRSCPRQGTDRQSHAASVEVAEHARGNRAAVRSRRARRQSLLRTDKSLMLPPDEGYRLGAEGPGAEDVLGV